MDTQFLGRNLEFWWILVFGSLLLYVIFTVAKRIILRRLEILAQKTSTRIDDLVTELVGSTKRYFLFGLAVYITSQLVQLEPAHRNALTKGFTLICLAQAASWGTKAIAFWVEHFLKKKAIEDSEAATSIGLITFLAKFLLFSLVTLLAIHNLGFNITTLIAGLGVGGIAVALAVQKILGDLFSSLTIVLDKPFVIGDFIAVGEFMGTIEHIGLKTTRLRSLSGEQLIFSNSDLLQSRLRNYKRMSERRVVFNLSLAFQTPSTQLARVPVLVREIISKHAVVRFDRCHFLKIGVSSFEFEVVYWVNSAEFNVYADVAQAINLEMVTRFAEEGLRLAYPTQVMIMEPREIGEPMSLGRLPQPSLPS